MRHNISKVPASFQELVVCCVMQHPKAMGCFNGDWLIDWFTFRTQVFTAYFFGHSSRRFTSSHAPSNGRRHIWSKQWYLYQGGKKTVLSPWFLRSLFLTSLQRVADSLACYWPKQCAEPTQVVFFRDYSGLWPCSFVTFFVPEWTECVLLNTQSNKIK